MCVCVCVCVYTHTYISHISFIHSSVDGHLSCFHILVMVNSATVNIGLHVSLWIIALYEVRLLDYMTALILAFWGDFILFSTVAAPIYIPTSSVEGLLACSIVQSCLTLWDPMDYSPPGSFVHGIFQARILERVAISSSRGSSQPRDWTPLRLLHWHVDSFQWATWEAPLEG